MGGKVGGGEYGMDKSSSRRGREKGKENSEDAKNGVDSKNMAGSQNGSVSFVENPKWLSTKDAAIYLRKFRKTDGRPSEGAIRTAIWRGEIKACKWRRRLYIRRQDIDRLLQQSPSLNGGIAWE